MSASVLAAARTAAGGSAVAVRRLEGTDRYLTARRVAAEFAAGVPGALLASGADFPDGVAAGPVAAALKGPVLLSPTSSLPSAVRAELTRLAPRRVVLAGGTGALSSSVESSAGSATGRQPERAAGADRYATRLPWRRCSSRRAGPEVPSWRPVSPSPTPWSVAWPRRVDTRPSS